jgi:Sulfotransferase family
MPIQSKTASGYLFVHIPKTAGTSFRGALANALGDDAVSPHFSASRLSEEDINRLDRYRVIAGHISIDDATPFRSRHLLTVLRNPTDRCLSWYYFARNQSAPGQSPEVRAAQECTVRDFFRLDRATIFRNIFNRQVRQLGGHVMNTDIDLNVALNRAKTTLRDAAWVGRIETLPSDLVRLQNRYLEFADFELPKLNITRNRKSLDALDPEIISQISSLNAYDLDLYCFATEEILAGRLG